MTIREEISEMNRIVGNFASGAGVLADLLLAAGDFQHAGEVLAASRLLQHHTEWFVTYGNLPAAPAVAAPVKPAALHEHDFRDAHGAESSICLICKKPKSTRGRKRTQQLIPSPSPHPSDASDDDICMTDGCGALVQVPGLPYCERHRVEKTTIKRATAVGASAEVSKVKIPRCEVQSCRNFAVPGSEYCDAHKHLAVKP